MKLTKSEIQTILTKHKNLLSLSDWKLDIMYNQSLIDAYAEAEFDVPFRKFTIKFDKRCDKLSKEDLTKTLIHELVHMKFGIMQQKFNDALKKVASEFEEELVDDLTWWYYNSTKR